jgi:hypothetical protein
VLESVQKFGRRWIRMVGNGSGDIRRGREKARLKWLNNKALDYADYRKVTSWLYYVTI